MPQQREIDGGRKALAGFLYQMVATIGLRAWADRDHADIVGDPHDEIVGLVSAGDIHHEHLQDAAIRTLNQIGQGEMALVQFKYSEAPERNSISTGDVAEIVKHLVKSTERAQQRGDDVTAYYLISNRPISRDVQRMEASRDQDLPNRYFTEYKWIAADGSKTAAYAVFAKLHILSDVSLESYVTHLEAFARDLGCFDDEISQGIQHLAGDLMYRVANRRTQPITRDELTKAFTADPATRSITLPTLATTNQNKIQFFEESQLDTDRSEPLRREIVGKIQEAAFEHYLVVLYGKGGYGKTSALISSFKELMNTRSVGLNLVPAEQLTNTYLVTGLICDWRNIATTNQTLRSEQTDVALSRLVIANPTASHPIVHIGLDGCDELRDGRLNPAYHPTRQIIEWFWQRERTSKPGTPPIATLIVTCRDPDSVHTMLNLQRVFRSSIEPFALEVDRFTWPELLQIAHLSSDDDLADTLAKAIEYLTEDNLDNSHSLDPSHPKVIGAHTREQATRSPDNSVLEGIRQPAIWMALMTLGPAERLLALQGDDAQLSRLAATYINWFCARALRRDARFSDADSITRALIWIAERSSMDNKYSRNTWCQAAEASGSYYPVEAGLLYKEALSAGLIDPDSSENGNQWRWRHPFVYQHLFALAGVGLEAIL